MQFWELVSHSTSLFHLQGNWNLNNSSYEKDQIVPKDWSTPFSKSLTVTSMQFNICLLYRLLRVSLQQVLKLFLCWTPLFMTEVGREVILALSYHFHISGIVVQQNTFSNCVKHKMSLQPTHKSYFPGLDSHLLFQLRTAGNKRMFCTVILFCISVGLGLLWSPEKMSK